MKHEIVIWSKSKSGKGFTIEGRVILDEMEIADIACEKWEEHHDLSEDRSYWGELEKTIHD